MSRSGRLSDAQKKRIVHLYKAGMLSQVQIAKRFGVSPSTVSKVIHDAGCGHKSRRYTPEEEQFLRENYRKMGPRALESKLRRSYDSIAHKALDMGLTGDCEVGPYGKRRKPAEKGDDA